MIPKFTHAQCHIDLEAIKNNFQQLGNPEKLMPVIKADAYGHGLLQVGKKLDECGARNFAVGTVPEGAALREAGFKQNIVPLMGALTQNEMEQGKSCKLVALIANFEDLEKIASIVQDHETLEIGIKCETGMSRLGFGLEELPFLLDKLASYKRLKPAFLISHLACADMPEKSELTLKQQMRFETFREALIGRFPDLKCSLGNSAISIGQSPLKYDICRPGIILYGGDPFAGKKKDPEKGKFQWAMSLSAPILKIRMIKAGDAVSYGARYVAKKDMKIGVIGLGYANGYPRVLSDRTQVLVNGKRAPQIGTICMSMMMIDLSDVKFCQEGDMAWIIGGEKTAADTPVTIQELADLAGTITYELLCNIGTANPRNYL